MQVPVCSAVARLACAEVISQACTAYSEQYQNHVYLYVQAIYVGNGIHRHCAKTELFTGPNDPNSDLSSVGNEYFCKIGCLDSDAVASRLPCGPTSSQRQRIATRPAKASSVRAGFAAQEVRMASWVLQRRGQLSGVLYSR